MMENRAETVYGLRKVSDDFYTIEENGVRCFLFVGEDEALLVDTGFGTGNICNFIKKVTDKPVKVVNTHTDGDHTGCNMFFDEIYMHPAEFDYYAQKSKKVPRAIWEGEKIRIGGYELEVVLIPGHTPGSIGLLERNRRFLISGDSVSRMPIFMFNQGRNIHAYIESMKKLEKMKDAFDVIYTSHGELEQEPGIISELIEGAEAIAAGKVEPMNPPRPLPCMLYKYKAVMFLCK